MAGQGAADLAALPPRLDSGLGLDEAGYVLVLNSAGDAAQLQLLNYGTATAAPRVALLAGVAAATAPSLMEQHLIAPGRLGVIVILPELQQAQKKRRTSTLPDGVSYDGNSFAGRVNWLPSAAPLPLIGKRTSAWRRLQGGQQTHKVAAHEVRRVVPHPAPAAAVAVEAIQVAADGTAEVRTAGPHPFSGAKQLATMQGLPGGLDGHYAVVSSNQRKSQLLFWIRLPRLETEQLAALQQAVADRSVTVSEQYILDDNHTINHFMLVGEGAAAGQAGAPAAAAAAAAGEAAASAAGGPALAATAGEIVPGFPHTAPGFPPLHPAVPLGLPGFGAMPDQLQQPGEPLNLTPLPELPELPLPGDEFGGMQLDAAFDEALLGAPPFFFEAAAPLPQQQQQQAQQAQQEQAQQQVAGGGQPPGAPSAAAGAGPAAGHALGQGHFRLLTVGGDQPVAGGPLYPGCALVVQGGAQVDGPLQAQSFAVVSDERLKERIQAFALAEGKRALDLVLSITCAVFNYKGEEEQRLGVVAQQVERELEQHGASHLGIVQRCPQGLLSIDISGLVTLLLASIQGLAGDMAELRSELAVLSLAAAGALQDTAAAAAAAAAGGSRGAAGGSSRGLSRNASGSSLRTAASSASSMAQLLDPADVELEESSGTDGSEAEQAAQAAAPAPPPMAQDEGEFAGLSDEDVAALLQQHLEPSNPHMRKKFAKLASQLSRAALWQVYQETIRQPTELTSKGDRPRTLGGQFVKKAGRRAAAEEVRRKAGSMPPPPKSLRGYQQRLLQVAQRGGNWIIVAPTGSGKTDVAVAHAVHVLQHDHSARVVFLAPTVALAEQQAGFFLAAPAFSGGTFRVACRAGDNTLQPRDWSRVLQVHHVVVMTPQTFLNALDAGYAHIDDLALLILDECHHAQADHPTVGILRAWHTSSQRTQILGLTASPAAKATLAATYEALAKLADNLGAQYLVLNENDPEVQAAVPEIAQEEIVVELAQQDAACAACLGGFVVAAVQQLQTLLPEVLSMLAAGRWTATAARWTVAAANALQAAGQPGGTAGEAQQAPAAAAAPAASAPVDHDLLHALLLVRAVVASLALLSDVGFEAALRHLSREYFAVAAKVASGIPADGTPGAASNAAAPVGGPQSIAASLLAQLAEAVDSAGVLLGAFSYEDGGLGRHPKFQALSTFLQGYSSQPGFHGIVFTRTRESARSVSQLLAAAPALEGVQVYCFMGHGGRTKARSGGGSGGGGMSSKQQQAVMADFRQAGRRLLVSTSAGEEGIDVPRCEFVVRYTATQTGRERMQTAGRARKIGSRFVEIIEASHEEISLIRKSRAEEANMRAAVRALGALGLHHS